MTQRPPVPLRCPSPHLPRRRQPYAALIGAAPLPAPMAVLLGARPSVVFRQVLFVCRYVCQSQALAPTTPADLDRRDERRRAAACGKVRRGMAADAAADSPAGRAAGGLAQGFRGC